MNRYGRIEAAAFGATQLPLPLSLRVSRRAEVAARAGDNDFFPASVQLGQAQVIAELEMRDTAVAEGLSLGRQDELAVVIGATRQGQRPRQVTLDGAVLVAVEISYSQAALAVAKLSFACQAAGGADDPFDAEDKP